MLNGVTSLQLSKYVTWLWFLLKTGSKGVRLKTIKSALYQSDNILVNIVSCINLNALCVFNSSHGI